MNRKGRIWVLLSLFNIDESAVDNKALTCSLPCDPEIVLGFKGLLGWSGIHGGLLHHGGGAVLYRWRCQWWGGVECTYRGWQFGRTVGGICLAGHWSFKLRMDVIWDAVASEKLPYMV